MLCHQINDEVEPASILVGSHHHVLVPQSPITHHPSRHLQRWISSDTCRAGLAPQRPHRRTSQHLRTSDASLGSPSSIPSSPTFIRSSSSAILERDLELLLLPPSPPHSANRHLNAHRIPRARGTAQLELSVPSARQHRRCCVRALGPSLGLGLRNWSVRTPSIASTVSNTFHSTIHPRPRPPISPVEFRPSRGCTIHRHYFSVARASTEGIVVRDSGSWLGTGLWERLECRTVESGMEWDGRAWGCNGWCGKDKAGGRGRDSGRGASCESLASCFGDC
ncbi:hypothetical protein DFP72DRAFT_517148 [Ephemerocybe angulata]|uniref:Uncharacterized protein n=1 Tax=Ephemerocybe angulata TaxID=980116 RepID=A0A8H6HNS0_9AGAR|nr:hypothetical protein DFP72DRAFT_517148 [Tulosesus angulatus]